jgi:hypothetical protein
MDSVKEIITRTLKGTKFGRRYNAEVVLLHWQEIVGDEIAKHTRPGKINGGILMVKTKNAVWAHHLMTLKEDIAAKINTFAGEKVVTDIKFQAGYLQNDQNEENTIGNETDTLIWSKETITEDELRDIENITGNISDDKLRRRIRNILVKDRSRRKVKAKNNWKPCQQCGIMCPPDSDFCTVCRIQRKAAGRGELKKLLAHAPWLSYNDCLKYVDCHLTEYNTYKNEMIDDLAGEIGQDQTDRIKVATLIMLAKGVTPEAITEELINSTLDKIRGKKNVFAPRR